MSQRRQFIAFEELSVEGKRKWRRKGIRKTEREGEGKEEREGGKKA